MELPRGAKTSAATKFKVHRHTVDRLWSRYNDSVAAGNLSGDVSYRYKENSGRKGYDRVELAAKIRSVPVDQRTNYQQTAKSLGLSVGFIFDMMTNKEQVKRTTTIKPILRPSNRERRPQWVWATSMLHHCTPLPNSQNDGHAFDPMLNLIHIDEKWFNHDKKTRHYLMLPDGEPRQRNLQSARHVEKNHVSGNSRPSEVIMPIFDNLWDPHRKTRFGGKIGLWPFAEDYVAQRSSKNRPEGTELMRNIKVVDTNVYKPF
ncbi:Mariner Transposase [Phytophthora megakarya]|uniref:Mariner Transposase n=1 Tax=Phytophthora megakarya TaxID=4795 RepID=A0A225V3J7_9STRA|nr:Mariner Transposase [Phytophthora megakarya]